MSDVEAVDPWLQHAVDVIFAQTGVNVSALAKGEDLLKFGRNTDVETAIATLMTLPDGIDNETYGGLITTAVSSAVADTQDLILEYHIEVDGGFTFGTQTVTLNGRTPVPLDPAVSRASRAYNNGSTDLTGVISFTEDDTFTDGVPDTDAGVRLQIRAGRNQSEKAAATLSSVDYWVITAYRCDMLTKAAAWAEVDLEVRLFGKTFRQVDDISCSDGHAGRYDFKPYLIVYPNSDIRLRSISDNASGRDVSGSIGGVLLTTEL